MNKEEFFNIEIDFKNQIFQFEKLNSFFSNNIFVIVRYVIILIGFFSLLSLSLSLGIIQNKPLLYFVLFISGPVLMSELFYRFNIREFKLPFNLETAKKQVESGDKIDYAQLIDLETAKLFLKVFKKNKNISIPILLEEICKSPRMVFVLNKLGIELSALKNIQLEKDQSVAENFKNILTFALIDATLNKQDKVSICNLFYGLVKVNTGQFKRLFIDLKITEEDIINVVFWEELVHSTKEKKRHRFSRENILSTGGIAKDWAWGYTSNLDNFSRDITREVQRRKINFSIIGRENAAARVEDTLTKEERGHALIIGDPGSGRTALVYDFAQKVVWGKTHKNLAFKRIVELDVGKLLTGAKNKGEADQRLTTILNDAVLAGNIILFVEDIQSLLDGEKPGTIDASEIIMPYLTEKRLQIIGSTNFTDWHKYIESKPKIADKFEKIEISETNERETLFILEDISLDFEKKYKVIITYKALRETIKLGARYIRDRAFPAKAIDILEDACLAARKNRKTYVDIEEVSSVISQKSNVPVGEVKEDEKEKLLNLEDTLHKRIIDQNEAVKTVSNALKRERAGLGSSKKPVGVFLFLGPTGVGKTELSKALANTYFGGDNAMIRMDMSEYQEISSIKRVIGPPPGEEGSESGGELTRKIKEKPFSLILLDEIEKAHPDILNLFLQVFDDGRLTDSQGRVVDFTNAIIIATSNAGSELIRNKVKQGIDLSKVEEELMDKLQKKGVFRAEFLNRFDDIILFKPLSPKEIIQIAKLMIEEVKGKLSEKGIKLKVTEEAVVELAQLGYNPEMGARPMHRIIQSKVEDMLANKLLNGEIEGGSSITLDKGEKVIVEGI